MTTHLSVIGVFKDGGSIHLVDKTTNNHYFLDNEIGSTTKGCLFTFNPKIHKKEHFALGEFEFVNTHVKKQIPEVTYIQQ